MSKNHTIIILGIFTAILPFLGFPQKFKTSLFLFIGLFVALLAYFTSRERSKESLKNHSFKSEESESIGHNVVNSDQNSLLK